jgi:hypothetical protein
MFCCNRTVHKLLWGLFWIALGTWLILSNYDLVAYQFTFHRDWPILLIAIGVVIIVRSFTRRREPWFAVNVNRCCGNNDKASREQILKAVEDGKMTADEAATKLKNG